MSRINVNDGEEDYPNAGALWHANLQRSLSGRKGQAILCELRDALLALPEKRLVDDCIANQQGEVCTVGALLVERRVRAGEDRETVLAELAAIDGEDTPTDEVAEKAGIPRLLAWWFAYVNDYEMYHLTPEQRYARVLADVESRITA